MFGQKADEDLQVLLEISGACEALDCLPRAGGLFDQDPGLVKAIIITRGLQQEKRNRDMPKPKK